MKIVKLRTNRLPNPLGFALNGAPRLSWVIEADKGTKATWAKVEIALDEGFEEIIFTSDKSEDIDSISYVPEGLEIQPRTRYYWRVTAETDGGEKATSQVAWFESSKEQEAWEADWISPDFDKEWHPILFTEFEVTKEIKSARAYLCGLGVYEAYLGGEKVGDEYLSPGLVAYDKWIPYQTYALDDMVKQGTNKLEIMLGNGWYKGRYGLVRRYTHQYGDEFSLIGEIVLEYTDGTSETITTNVTDWKAKRSTITGTILTCNIFDGEIRDDTFEDPAVYDVKLSKEDKSLLEPRRSPATKIMHRLKPVEVITTPAGETVLDMGQNMVGWVEFRCKAPKGSKVHLQFGEVLQEDNFYRDNMRTALCEYHYTSDGEEKIVRPYFTFYGFRYVKLTQWEGEVNPEDFTGCVLYSEMEQTGDIKTSNEKVNRLFENTLWGQRGNFLDVPTDCPQRDERMGWTGDAQVFFGTAAYNMDVSAFFDKFCYDLAQEQKVLDGDVPVVIPKHDVAQTGACGWGDAATIIPWNMYVRYGDRIFLENQYPSMKAWVDYVHGRDEATGGSRLWKGNFHYGDWLSLDAEGSKDNRFGGTERVYLASCFYRHSSLLTAKAARVLGKTEEAEYYEALSEEIRQAIIKEYFTTTGRLSLNTQTSLILALFMDIVPEEWREKTAYALRLKLIENEYHLRTGFLGTPYLCRVLSETGSNDIAYRLVLQEGFPSWLYQVNMGATTIWERWNSILPDGSISDTGMNSLNHYSYGSIIEWFYRNAAGINPIEEYPGFRRFRFAPQPHYFLPEVMASFDSPVGEIKSGWKVAENGEVTIQLTVPFGATAEVFLPHAEGTEYQDMQELTAGDYSFTYKPAKDTVLVFDMDTPIDVLYEYQDMQELLQKELPHLTSMMLFTMLASKRSLNDLRKEGILQLSDTDAAVLVEKMQQVPTK